MDVHDEKTRSFNMSMIKEKDTKPEIIVRKFLHSNGFRFRLNYSKLPGKPDITLKKHKTIIFVHGCFWHGHDGCKYFKIPKTRSTWWKKKIDNNIQRDRNIVAKLEKNSWKVLTVWECELVTGKKQKTLENIVDEIGRNNENTSN